mmetsp:Transcript_2206/g.5607  ORF Transcript_2206/g.5607 Transcript_2206/m.5607 type:complete len:406 (-) Transcript_2206:792-2009(-)
MSRLATAGCLFFLPLTVFSTLLMLWRLMSDSGWGTNPSSASLAPPTPHALRARPAYQQAWPLFATSSPPQLSTASVTKMSADEGSSRLAREGATASALLPPLRIMSVHCGLGGGVDHSATSSSVLGACLPGELRAALPAPAAMLFRASCRSPAATASPYSWDSAGERCRPLGPAMRASRPLGVPDATLLGTDEQQLQVVVDREGADDRPDASSIWMISSSSSPAASSACQSWYAWASMAVPPGPWPQPHPKAAARHRWLPGAAWCCCCCMYSVVVPPAVWAAWQEQEQAEQAPAAAAMGMGMGSGRLRTRRVTLSQWLAMASRTSCAGSTLSCRKRSSSGSAVSRSLSLRAWSKGRIGTRLHGWFSAASMESSTSSVWVRGLPRRERSLTHPHMGASTVCSPYRR